MKTYLSLIFSAAIVAPLFFAGPAEAQTYDQIQELEERVAEARQRGDWGYARDLNVQLNMLRKQYQENRGLPEYSDRSTPYNQRYYRNDRSRRPYYDQRYQRRYKRHPGQGQWRRY